MHQANVVFNIHTQMQSIIPLPYWLDISNWYLSDSPLYQKSFHKNIRKFQFSLTIFYVFILIVRALWYILFWSYYSTHAPKQLVLISLCLCMMGVANTANMLGIIHSKSIQYSINQLFKLAFEDGYHLQHRSGLGWKTIEKIVTYGVSYTLLIFAAGSSYIPFRTSRDTIQSTFGTHFIVKIGASLIYASVMVRGVWVFLSIMLLSNLILEGIRFLSERMHGTHQFHCVRTRKEFLSCHRRFLNIRLMLQINNQIYSEFMTLLIFLGVIIATLGVYIMVRMFDNLPVTLYITLSALTGISILIAISKTYQANYPHKNGKLFKLYWRRELIRKGDLRVLRACPEIGIPLGPYGIVTARLGIIISDDIIRNAVDLLLLT